MNLSDLLGALLHTSERVVPIFIHNARSQAIEAIIFGAAEEAVAAQKALAAERAAQASAPVVANTLPTAQ